MRFQNPTSSARALRTIFSMVLLCLACAGTVLTTTVIAGAIYKSVDKDGNIIFTDRPLEGSENINGEEPAAAGVAPNSDDDYSNRDGVALTPEPKNPPKPSYQEPASSAKSLPVTVVEILTPIHNTTLHDPIGKIWVELQSYPTPMKKSGLTAELWVNDQLVTSGKRPMLSLPKPERGTQILQVKLVDDKGRLFLESAKSHIHVKYRVTSK